MRSTSAPNVLPTTNRSVACDHRRCGTAGLTLALRPAHAQTQHTILSRLPATLASSDDATAVAGETKTYQKPYSIGLISSQNNVGRVAVNSIRVMLLMLLNPYFNVSRSNSRSGEPFCNAPRFRIQTTATNQSINSDEQ